MNYLRPNIKRGNISPDEDDLIIRLHSLLGNRWSLIAGRLPGRTDNEIKNYWNTHLSKRLRCQGTDPHTHKKLMEPVQELKRRNNKNNNTTTNRSSNRKQKNKSTANVEPEKPKVHLPKPIRVTSFPLPRNGSFECNTLSGSSGQEGEGCFDSKVVDIPWCEFKDGKVSFLVGCDDQGLVSGSDNLECQSHLPTGNNSLEKLYEEYLELLKTEENQVELDSFAESLLI